MYFLCGPHAINLPSEQDIYVQVDNKMVVAILEYEFIVIYKLRKTHVMVDALVILFDTQELVGVLNQTINVYFIYNTTYMDQGGIILFTIGQFSNNFTIT